MIKQSKPKPIVTLKMFDQVCSFADIEPDMAAQFVKREILQSYPDATFHDQEILIRLDLLGMRQIRIYYTSMTKQRGKKK
jgi:hypothetical protein